MSVRLRLLTACSLLAVPVAAHADDDVRLSAQASATTGYSNNPFSETTGNTGSGFAQVEVQPRITYQTNRNVFTLDGLVQYQQYFRRYDSSEDYQVRLDYRGTPSEHVATHLNLGYDNSVIGGFDSFSTSVADPSVPQTPIVSGTDIALFGTRDRRQTLSANGDIAVALSALDNVNASAFVIDTRYRDSGALNDYDGYGGSLGYARQVSEHVQLGLRGSAARYDYKGLLSDSNVYSGQVTLAMALSERWKLDGALGVSFVDTSDTGGAKASVSGNLNLCHTGDRATLCLTARRAVLPTGLTGTQEETSAGGSYRYRVTEHGTLSFAADYTNNGSNQLVLASEYLRGSVTFEQALTKRLRLIATSYYREIFGGAANQASDFGGQIGFAVNIGDHR